MTDGVFAEKRRVEMRVPSVGRLCSEMGANGAAGDRATSQRVRNVRASCAKRLVFGE